MPVDLAGSGTGEMVAQSDKGEVVVGIDAQSENRVDEGTGIEVVTDEAGGTSEVIFPKLQMLLIGDTGR